MKVKTNLHIPGLADLDEIDPTFERDLLGSDEAVDRMALYFVQHGCAVHKPPLEVRPDVELRHEYADSGDLFVKWPNTDDWIEVEVKHAKRAGDFVDSWPYPTVILDPVHKIERKGWPVAYAVVNQNMTYFIWIEVQKADLKIEEVGTPPRPKYTVTADRLDYYPLGR